MRYAKSEVVPVTLVVTGAYDAGDALGGAVRLPRAAGGHRNAVLKNLFVVDTAAQTAGFTVLLFNALPTGTVADNAAYTMSDADAAKLVAKVPVATGDFQSIGGKSMASVEVAVVLNGNAVAAPSDEIVSSSTNGDLWLVVVTSGTPTYTASSLKLQFGMLQD